MGTFDTDQLSRRIEEVIQEHLVASERAAAEALSRAFAARRRAASFRSRAVAERGEARRRRSRSELAEVVDRLYQAVCARPGEAMAVLALEVGHTPRALNRPMSQLRQKGLVRSVGQRHLTRYFPLSPKG